MMYGIQATVEHIATVVIKSVFQDAELPAKRRFFVDVRSRHSSRISPLCSNKCRKGLVILLADIFLIY